MIKQNSQIAHYLWYYVKSFGIGSTVGQITPAQRRQVVQPDRDLTSTAIQSLVDTQCCNLADPALSFHLKPTPQITGCMWRASDHTQTTPQTKVFNTRTPSTPTWENSDLQWSD